MKRNTTLTLALLISLLLPGWLFADDKEELSQEVAEAKQLFLEKDAGLKQLMSDAAGYAVFPKVAKGGFGVGAARGTGQLLVADKAIGETKLTQVTVGLQLGGQVYAELILFENEEVLNNFKEGNVEFSAQVSAVAAAEGASKNAKFEHGVMVFTIAKGGLMYEASVGGQKFGFDAY